MTVSKSMFVVAASAAALGLSAPAFAGSANGTWLRGNGAHVLAFDCGGGLGLNVTKSPEHGKGGKTIIGGDNKHGEKE